MEAILKIEHLSKTLGTREILHDISFETYGGEVFGFLGPNGAGKTTLIKVVVGLLTLDTGKVTIAGHDLAKNFESALASLGAIVENPEFYKFLSGYDNLLQYANMRGGVDKARIDEVVRMVGLENRIKEKVGRYSLGMRQRLGVAQAILHHPKLLVLDEPTNGLDPAGIKDLRDILKNLAHKEGVAVMVSSHLMSEMELMCDRVGVIANGVLRSVHPIDELVSAAGIGQEEFVFSVDDPIKAAELFAKEFAVEVAPNEDGKIDLTFSKEESLASLARANRLLIEEGLNLYTVSKKENRRLEDVFIELTRGEGTQIG